MAIIGLGHRYIALPVRGALSSINEFICKAFSYSLDVPECTLTSTSC